MVFSIALDVEFLHSISFLYLLRLPIDETTIRWAQSSISFLLLSLAEFLIPSYYSCLTALFTSLLVVFILYSLLSLSFLPNITITSLILKTRILILVILFLLVVLYLFVLPYSRYNKYCWDVWTFIVYSSTSTYCNTLFVVITHNIKQSLIDNVDKVLPI